MELLLKTIIQAIDEKQGENIEIIDVTPNTPLASYYVICSASNVRKLNAIKEGIVERLEKMRLPIHHVEGTTESGWILVDAYDVIVHIFSEENRQEINLETLLKGLKRIPAEGINKVGK